MEIERDAHGAPVLLRIGTLLTTLERMVDHRREQLQSVSTAGGRGKISPAVADYYRAECLALEASMAALVYHRATMQGLPEFVSALRAVAEASEDPGALKSAARRAAIVLAEYDRQNEG
jgi:hypothetical protein